MPRIALVTARAARGLDPDMPLLLASLRDAGADAHEVDWDDDSIDWSRFDVALLRSTWDYVERLPEFIGWAQRVSRQTHLLNPIEVIRWNTDKHYLAALTRAGVATVPSRFVEPGEDAAAATDAFLLASAHSSAASSTANGGTESPDVVVKPAVGAGSRDAQRHARSARDAIVAHVRNLLDRDRSVLLQPYLPRIEADGETSLLFFDGVFSHAIRKEPLLRRGARPATGLFAKETTAPRSAAPDELAIAQRALAAIPYVQPLLYARVDLIRGDGGTPCVLELELTEPSAFLTDAPEAATRFAAATLRRLPPQPEVSRRQ